MNITFFIGIENVPVKWKMEEQGNDIHYPTRLN